VSAGGCSSLLNLSFRVDRVSCSGIFLVFGQEGFDVCYSGERDTRLRAGDGWDLERESLWKQTYFHGLFPHFRKIMSVSKGDYPPYSRWGRGYSLVSPRLISTACPFQVGRSHTRSGDIPGPSGVPGCCNRGKSHFPPSRGLPSIYFQEDDQPWETPPPAILPSGYPPR